MKNSKMPDTFQRDDDSDSKGYEILPLKRDSNKLIQNEEGDSSDDEGITSPITKPLAQSTQNHIEESLDSDGQNDSENDNIVVKKEYYSDGSDDSRSGDTVRPRVDDGSSNMNMLKTNSSKKTNKETFQLEGSSFNEDENTVPDQFNRKHGDSNNLNKHLPLSHLELKRSKLTNIHLNDDGGCSKIKNAQISNLNKCSVEDSENNGINSVQKESHTGYGSSDDDDVTKGGLNTKSPTKSARRKQYSVLFQSSSDEETQTKICSKITKKNVVGEKSENKSPAKKSPKKLSSFSHESSSDEEVQKDKSPKITNTRISERESENKSPAKSSPKKQISLHSESCSNKERQVRKSPKDTKTEVIQKQLVNRSPAKSSPKKHSVMRFKSSSDEELQIPGARPQSTKTDVVKHQFENKSTTESSPKKRSLHYESSSDEEEQRRKSPPKIMMTEIVSTKYKIVNNEEHTSSDEPVTQKPIRKLGNNEKYNSSLRRSLRSDDDSSDDDSEKTAAARKLQQLKKINLTRNDNSSSSDERTIVKKRGSSIDDNQKRTMISNENSNDSTSSDEGKPVKSQTLSNMNTENAFNTDDSSSDKKQSLSLKKDISSVDENGYFDDDDDGEQSAKRGSSLSVEKQFNDSNEGSKVMSLKRRISNNDSAEVVPSKYSKITRVRKSLHTMSDSDTEDSLTKVNTELNKSMTLMESSSEPLEQPSNSRKSVKITVKKQPPSVRSDVTSRKSILKRPDVTKNNDGEEEDRSLEQSPHRDVDNQLLTNSTILPRPLNLLEFLRNNTVAVDPTDATFGLNDFSDSEDIWIMDIPKTVRD